MWPHLTLPGEVRGLLSFVAKGIFIDNRNKVSSNIVGYSVHIIHNIDGVINTDRRNVFCICRRINGRVK